jgi:PAS domain S-box-containing protein
LETVFGFPVIADEEIIAILVFCAWEEIVPHPDLLMVIDNLRHQLGRMVERKRWIEERARLAAIVDSSYDAIIGKDLDGRIITWNHGAEQVYGYQPHEVLGKSIRMLLPLGMEEEESSVTDVVATGHRLKMFETKRRCKDGTIIDVALAVSPIRDSRGRIVGSSSIERDVTLRKKKDKELLQAKREAEQANRAKSEFLANISHELRTPMNAILGMLHLSLGEDLSEPQRDYLKTAHESAQTLLYLLNDLLDFSRMAAGHMELEHEPFRLRETLDMAIKSLSLKASEKGLELACHIGKNVPNALSGDAVRLRQIIVNLAGNGIKFTDQGEVVVNVNVQSQSGNQVALRFSVRDTGIGIPKQHQEKIFAPFTQVDASTTRNETGSGLGLAIVRELVGKMGGTIGLESEPGRGSHFYFTVPFEVLPEVRTAPDGQELFGLPVLVVDDNRTNQVILEETLANWSMRPTVVGSAKAALKAIQDAEGQGASFPLIIVDALMPEMDGFMLVEKIHESHPDSASPMTVLMLSSADRQTFKQRCENLKVQAYLEKPISQSVLMDTLMTVLKGPLLDRKSFEQVKPLPVGLSILVAEDTPANQKVIRAILEKRGHRVQIANNGREAVDQVKQGRYDVVLMDVQMPTMDGLQATHTIRNLSNPAKAEIPIVAMTAHARREDRRKCLSAGMDAYIAKPIDAGKLIHLVETAEHREEAYRASETWESDFMPLSTAVINVESAKARMGGNEPLVVDLAKFFLEDVPKLVKDLERALQESRAEEVERAAHSVKGLAANFDAETLATLASSLEAHGRNGDIDQARRQFAELRDAAKTVCREIEEYLDSQ